MTAASYVTSSVNYTQDNGARHEYYLYEIDESVPVNRPGTDPQEVRIHDAWAQADQFTLDRQGFQIERFEQAFDRFDDDELVKQAFYPLVVEHVKRHTGASRVVIFDHTIRRRMGKELAGQTDVQRPAVQLVHCDYTVKSGPQRVRDVLPGEAERLLEGRVAFYNLWKPLYETVEELPLAMCDVTTTAPGDMLVMDLKYRDRLGEIYVMRHSPQHRWYYFPRMEPKQALLLKTYDSLTDGRARFMGHTAFEDPNTPVGALKRQSIEVRTMAFFDKPA